MNSLRASFRVLDRADPWTNVYGLARSLLAVATLTTLLTTPTSTLFSPMRGAPDPALYPACGGPASFSLFCILRDHLTSAHGIAVVFLAVTVSGWRPRVTGLLHWWVSVSLILSASTLDGGDHVTALMTLFLLPVTLTDPRPNHWSAPRSRPLGFRKLAALSSVIAIRIQTATIYLHAAVGKLAVPEWVDGTAVYYWLTDPYFGAPRWARPLVLPLLDSALIVTLLTFGSIALELGLFAALFMPRRSRLLMLPFGIGFHLGIALLLGIPSFSVAMMAVLVLYLWPWSKPFLQLRQKTPRLDRRNPPLAFSRERGRRV